MAVGLKSILQIIISKIVQKLYIAIGDFFVRKISKIGAEIDAVVLDQSAVDMVPGDLKFPADRLLAFRLRSRSFLMRMFERW